MTSGKTLRRIYIPLCRVILVFAVLGFPKPAAATTQTGAPLFRYAAFATSNTCGAVTFSANYTDSFDSSLGTYAATKQNTGGNVGANGNISLSGATVVNGTASTPHTGQGVCSSQSITGLTTIEGSLVKGGVILGGPLAYPNPPAPTPLPPTVTQSLTGTCAGLNGCTALPGSNNLALAPGSYGNLNISGGTTVHLRTGTYNLNSAFLSGNSTLVIDATPVLLNIAGQNLGKKNSAVDFSGGTLINSGAVPSGFQLIYGGTAPIGLSGGSASFGVVYAPSSPISLSGGSDWYGAIVGSTIYSNVPIHFDRSLGDTPLGITASADPPANAAGWNNTNATVTFTCSGILITACPSPITVSTEGANQQISGTVRDISGDVVTVTIVVKIDKTPPTVTASRLPAANARGWNNTNVTGSFVGNDPLSGLAACTTPITVTTEGANQSVSGTCTDVAGNVSPPVTISGINIDKTPPTLTFSSPNPAANAAGWNNTNVSFPFTTADSFSGVLSTSVPSPLALSAEGIAVSGTVTVADVAGNSAAFRSPSVKIDKTPPVLTITSPANGAVLFSSNVAESGTATDAVSGIDMVTCNGTLATVTGTAFSCAVTLSAIGSNTLNTVATDAAGNSTPAQVSVTYSQVPKITLTSPANLSWFNISPTTVTGTVDDPNATVMVNAVQAAVVNGSFSVAVPLQEGPNTITAVATNAAGVAGTASLEVNLDTTPPHVTITSPPDKFVTTEASISVAGNVNDIVVGTVNANQASVSVNGVGAQVANRTFIATGVPLSVGPNIIQATGRDRVGNYATTQITVTRQAVTMQAQITLVSGNNQTGTIDAALTAPLVVALTDSNGNPAANKAVIFSVTQNNGTVSNLSLGAAGASSVVATTNAQGQAQVQWTLGMRAGAGGNTVEAYAVGYSGTAIFSATGNQGPAGGIVVDTGNNQIGAIGQPLPKPFIAVVVDAGNNRLGGVPVTFTVAQGGGSFDGQPTYIVTSDSDGRVAATLTLGMQEGNGNNLVQATFPSNQGFPAVFTASGRAAGPAANTIISGVVLDNSNVPIRGVTVRAVLTTVLNANGSSAQSAPAVQTDAQGQFTLIPAPVGALKLIVDGSTAQRPGTWPSLEYDLVTVSGQNNTVGNSIYLLPLNPANQLCVSATTGGGTLTMPEAPGFSLTFSPGQVTFPGGSQTGCISVTVVHPDKVPMVPGFGQQPRFIVTIQPPGAMFNPPAAITMPNVDGLAPRAVTEMYSYDHDISSFVAIGTGVVSDDGQVIRSSPGVGVLKSGWHCGGNPNQTGAAATCPTCMFCQGTQCTPQGNGTSCGGTGACQFTGQNSQPTCNCPTGQFLINNLCQNPPPGCNPTTCNGVCNGGVCLGQGNQCPTVCNGGSCVNGVCVNQACSGQSSGSCTMGGLQPGTCQNGQCVGNNPNQCPAYCNGSTCLNGICTQTCNGGNNGALCNSGGVVPGVCSGNQCQGQGNQCPSSCVSGICSNGTCQPVAAEYDPGPAILDAGSIPYVHNDIEVSAGEKVIFNVSFADQDQQRPVGAMTWTPINGQGPYQITMTIDGPAEWNGPGGPKTATFNALSTGNVYLYADADWADGTTIMVTATIQDDASNVAPSPNIGTTKDPDFTLRWTLVKRMGQCPTMMTTQAGTDPSYPGDFFSAPNAFTPAPGKYRYQMGPSLPGPSPYYASQTILESFGSIHAYQFAMGDVTQDFKNRYPLLATPDLVANYIWQHRTFTHGTFVIDTNDHIFDRHDGGSFDNTDSSFGLPSIQIFTNAAWAYGVGFTLDQTYSCGPTNIQNYTITHRYINGSESISKTGP
jgi:hypothetical protein